MSTQACAVESVELEMGTVEFEYGKAFGVKISVPGIGKPLSIHGSARKVVLNHLSQPIENIEFNCDEFVYDGDWVKCLNGSLDIPLPWLDDPHIEFDLSYQIEEQQFEAYLNASAIGGKVKVQAHGKGIDISANVAGDHDLQKLPQWINNYIPSDETFSGTGHVEYDLDLTTLSDGSYLLNGIITGRDINYVNELGLKGVYAATFDYLTDITISSNQILFDSSMEIAKGATFLLMEEDLEKDSVTLNNENGSVKVDVWGKYDLSSKALHLENIRFNHEKIIDFSIQADLEPEAEAPLKKAKIELNSLDIGDFLSAYQVSISAINDHFIFANWKLDGLVQGEGQIDENGRIDLSCSVSDFYIDDVLQQRIRAKGVNGFINWSNSSEVLDSIVGWETLTLLSVNMGRTSFSFQTTNETVNIPSINIPFLPVGDLKLAQMECAQCFQSNRRVSLAARLSPTPIGSLWQITGSDGAPVDGLVESAMPGIRYQEGRMELDGAMSVNLFEGQILLDNLVLEDPAGLLPKLKGDIEVNRLNLEELTKTYDFGRITGRIDGHVRDFELVDWQPVKFDAAIYSTPDDDSPKRISQRAISNISEIGGASGALAAWYMGFFKEFRYSAIGISCRLQGDVCDMSGLDPQGDQFYIVKKTFLPPSVDIKGFNSKVGWSELMDKINLIISSAGNATGDEVKVE